MRDIGDKSKDLRVVIIGGGPAGTACALASKRLAQGRRVDITIVEGKKFAQEQHFNQCVGVLSPPLPELLTTCLDVAFPSHLSRGEIEGYILHTGQETITLDGDMQPSTAVRRVQFDAYMLETAQERGIRVFSARAVDLEFHADRVVIYTENASLEADVVVGAFGLDEGTGALFARQTPYRPPQALSSVVTKYHPGSPLEEAAGRYIHAFLPDHPRIEFGAVTPKGNHLTINIAGRSVDAPMMQYFLSLPEVQGVLPNFAEAGKWNADDQQFFKGRFPCSLARCYSGDRYVMVGDAAGLVRTFKGKGVTSGILTGIRAAETILNAGITAEAFDAHYRLANRDILSDLPFGQFMRRATILFSRYHLLDPIVRAAHNDPSLHKGLFDAVSAHASYRDVMRNILKPRVVARIVREFVNVHV